VATTRPQCLYCRAAEPIDASTRVLVVLELAGTEPAGVAAALAISAYDAGQYVRRGGFQPHRMLEPDAARAELDRLAAAGMTALLVPESEIRQARVPRAARGGRFDGNALRLRMDEGPLIVGRNDATCIVRGPIVREYATSSEVRRVRAAGLADGYRIHLFTGTDTRPIELDPGTFAFDASERHAGSSLLELLSWIREFEATAVTDIDFKRLPPTLAPADEDPLVATASLLEGRARPTGKDSGEGPVVLDNLAQFRHYSGWRAAVARRLGR